jgi:hypothetical protein
MGVGCQRHAPVALSAGKKATTHFIGCWVVPTAGLDGCGKIRPPLGFDSWTVQPVMSCCIL